MIRLFAAVTPPFEVTETLRARQEGLPGARWRPQEALHITLRFFGEVAEPAAQDLEAELSQVRGATFDLSLQGVGAFGEGERLTSVWAGLAPSPPLEQLAHRCDRAARRAGLKAATRTFRPHLTLAYLDRHVAPDRVAGWIQDHNLLSSPPFRVDAFGLYSGHLGKEGSRYRLERSWRL